MTRARARSSRSRARFPVSVWTESSHCCPGAPGTSREAHRQPVECAFECHRARRQPSGPNRRVLETDLQLLVGTERDAIRAAGPARSVPCHLRRPGRCRRRQARASSSTPMPPSLGHAGRRPLGFLPELAGCRARLWRDRPRASCTVSTRTLCLLVVARTPDAYRSLTAQWRRAPCAEVPCHSRAAPSRREAGVVMRRSDGRCVIPPDGGCHGRSRGAHALPCARQIRRAARGDLSGVAPGDRPHSSDSVHLAAIGHPVVGDARYGGDRRRSGAPRPFLHAAGLAFVDPATRKRSVHLSVARRSRRGTRTFLLTRPVLGQPAPEATLGCDTGRYHRSTAGEDRAEAQAAS